MPDNVENTPAFLELIRVLEDSVRAGVTSLSLEWKGRELMVFYQAGMVGLGAARISVSLQGAVIKELIGRAGLARKARGKMQITLLRMEFDVIVEEYDSFGESAFNLTLKERKKKAER